MEKVITSGTETELRSGKAPAVAPLTGFPGIGLAGTTIKLAQQNYKEHIKVLNSLVERYKPAIQFFLMDLSVEANALGRYTIFPVDESATVPKRDFDFGETEGLRRIDITADSRVVSYVETMKLMKRDFPESTAKGAYVTGPFTLAGLIMGAEDAAMAAIMEPDNLDRLTEFASEKILDYTKLLIDAGADIVCILEPSGVMLSPDQFETFSTTKAKKIIDYCSDKGVKSIYHVCGNSNHLVDPMVKAGVNGLSLDSEDTGVNLAEIAARVPSNVSLIGNINPTGKILNGNKADVEEEVRTLRNKMEKYKNFILSTGCDLPPEVPPENIDSFIKAGRE